MRRGGRRPAVLQHPEEGWSSLFLSLSLIALLGVSIVDARPLALIAGGGSATGGLPVLMIAAGLIGFILARSPLGVVRAHLLGAVTAALLLLLTAGAALQPEAAPLALGLDEVSERVAAVWERLDADVAAYLGTTTSTPTVATYLVLGAICWTTAQFSVFSVFRYGRAGPAVMAVGGVLFLNLALGSLQAADDRLPVLPVLALYTTLAMLLLMRLQLVEQRRQWARRHIADSGEVSRLFLRSGVAFVVFSVVSATSLTAWASVDAQEVDFGALEQPAEELGAEISRWLGLFGVPPPEVEPVTIGDTWPVQDRWVELDGVAFRATVDGSLRGNYWWGWAHDHFDGWTWDRDKLRSVAVEAGEPLPVREAATAGGPHALTTEITVARASLARGMLLRPADAAVVDRAVTVHTVDEGEGIGDVTYDEEMDRGDRVVVNAWVRDYREGATTLTANELRVAGDDYPAWLERYRQGGHDETIVGRRVGPEAAEIMALHDNAYDRAIEVQGRLQAMAYTSDMAGVCRDDEPVPGCVLRAERGFCQHYATTMAMLLRAMDVPSRVVTGYLPGTRREGRWVVEQAAFHNWVEAYFPGTGWVRFDPTPATRGFGQAATSFPDGAVIEPGASPEPQATIGPEDVGATPSPDPFEGTAVVPPGSDDDLGGRHLLLGGLAAVLVVLVGAGLVLRRLRYLPGGDGSLAYRGIVDLATRLGYGPHPAQTEYEYAGTLSDVIPGVREDLYLVTDARVETVYGGHELGEERHGRLARAYARIRTALLRLSLRFRR